MLREKLYRSIVELTNGRWTSFLLKHFTTSRISKRLISSYIHIYDIKLDEVSEKKEDFRNLHDFFIRRLRENARLIEEGACVYTSPVDAKIESFGDIEKNTTFYVKGKTYDLKDLLGKDEIVNHYINGKYIVFYLSPADYHRFHSPIDAKVIRQFTLGRKSYPVNRLGLTYGNQPISKNYRQITELITKNGSRCAFIKVGAMFVNSIHITNTSEKWNKGEEVGFFGFGSTVVMLFNENSIQFSENVIQGMHIKVGQAFAHML
ncbi:phosphatidylserine decarboxylase [Rummeliibacillus suwonensis]|uniref:phosphatidylserine decarboxylase n=1 Tax=Rummeliibacillus suwonensis TaxID=1306154 RepID=UPI00289B7DD9|nr:phosphatidylserine decarboxylase [Rummeliibacillus suwonensis]